MDKKGFMQSLFEFFSKPAEETKGQVPAGACPNCWGFYEYDSEIRNVIKDREIDVQNHQQTRAFIENFVVNHIDGIHLREHNEEGLERCPRCGKIY